jgi:hypothetical protein
MFSLSNVVALSYLFILYKYSISEKQKVIFSIERERLKKKNSPNKVRLLLDIKPYVKN